MKQKIIVSSIIVLSLLVFYFFNKTNKVILEGMTMGTTFKIIYYCPIYKSDNNINHKIINSLNNDSKTFSTYSNISEISRFNLKRTLGQIKVSSSFLELLNLSKRLYRESDGLYDPTVKPLVDLWGFGKNKKLVVPSNNIINEVRTIVGLNNIIIEEKKVRKVFKHIELDFSSSAKGLAVDNVQRILTKNKVKSYLIEIGGEISASQFKGKKDFWIVGIVDPRYKQKKEYAKINLINQSIATSGDYQQYFKYKNKFYSHIINPKTGFPIEHKLTSVTVVANSCAEADAYATLLMLMSVKDGLNFTEKNENLEALFLIKSGNEIIPLKTKGFPFLALNKE
ncbi:thiamine biosynthesis protein ApbE [Candidatus Marinamargulisbacteria bacterium SCGC AG-410-N11]|nr:thiamine biosynthesis protein ApbE [Candidatus Marinamargulisbacteria bacterium SCGC AG-410-N11]